jgi:hypothetical protein
MHTTGYYRRAFGLVIKMLPGLTTYVVTRKRNTVKSEDSRLRGTTSSRGYVCPGDDPSEPVLTITREVSYYRRGRKELDLVVHLSNDYYTGAVYSVTYVAVVSCDGYELRYHWWM